VLFKIHLYKHFEANQIFSILSPNTLTMDPFTWALDKTDFYSIRSGYHTVEVFEELSNHVSSIPNPIDHLWKKI